jgi:Ni/Co efflux regulator RcnB
MKKLVAAAALAGLFATTAALAQNDHRRDDHPGGGPGGRPEAARGAGTEHHDDRGPQRGSAPQAGPATHGPAMQGPARPAMAGPNRPQNDRHDNGVRGNAMGGGPRRDFSSYHRNFNAPRRFHAAPYRRPPGFYVHHWSYGEVLPRPFWVRDYWLTDFFDFGLAPPPPGTVWVRYGSDALLIDEYDGDVIEVAYNVFY